MIDKNFKLSILITIIAGFLSFFYMATGFPEVLSHLFGKYKLETMAFPLVIITLEVLAWFIYYKDEEGHLIAFIVGFFMLLPVAGSLISESVNDIRFNRIELWLLTYLGVSHVLYSLTNWRELLKGLGEHE